MLHPIKVVDIELSKPISTVTELTGYMGVQGLVRLHGVPLGYVKAPVSLGECTAATLGKLIVEQLSSAIINQLLKNGLASTTPLDQLKLEDLVDLPPVEYDGKWPLVTVAVCTRDRPEDIRRCLAAICQLDYPNLDLLVIDNAPQTEATRVLIKADYPQVRYAREPRPGLDWARNRAILEAKGEIIAYTDDDVVVDSGWVKGLAQVFAENSAVMAVTGLVVPYELETEAQVLFESYGGFGRGFERKWYSKTTDALFWQWFGAGQFGTGANMAYRRSVFETIGAFDPALDVGTITNGGGDLEMFIRVLISGHTLVYEPRAMIRHRHRREYEQLRRQISYNGIGLYSLFSCLTTAYPDHWFSLFYIRIWWLAWWHVRRLVRSFIHPQRFPRDLIVAEFESVFQHFGCYQKACQRAKEIAQTHPQEPQLSAVRPLRKRLRWIKKRISLEPLAIRSIDLSQPLTALTDVSAYSSVRLFVSWQQHLLGAIDITNANQELSKSRLAESIIPAFRFKLLGAARSVKAEAVQSALELMLLRRWAASNDRISDRPPLPSDIVVSVALATYDRPDDLRRCLTTLVAQQSPRQVEIIVVDNHPASGLTAPVVADFPQVKLVEEDRQGLSYARNAGIIASRGEIIITTDDDVTMPNDWIETLIRPFRREDVMVVTGNVLPVELETPSQRNFETYGGLGRGFEPTEVDGEWFEACAYRTVPTWTLGATANAAFRASIFRNEAIGLIDEALGAGTPTGCSEDTYIFYKVLKLGYTIFYEPDAFVWHRHRDSSKAFRLQIYNYSKGHVAYHLTTLLNDGDLRVFARLLVGLPLIHLWRIYARLRGWTEYSIFLVLLEISGNLAGPWALWRSHRQVNKMGRSRFDDSIQLCASESLEPISSVDNSNSNLSQPLLELHLSSDVVEAEEANAK